MEWYTIENIDSLDSPALVIYPDRVKRNIALVKKMVPDVENLRPHVKTNKCAQVVDLMLEGGIAKFKCATIAEAEMLAVQGAADVLLAYQPVGPKAQRFCELQLKFPKTTFSCLLDNQRSLSELSKFAGKNGVTIKVFIDLNVGMNRTGIPAGPEALKLFGDAAQAKGIEVIGLHAYDGHIRDVDVAARTQKCDDAFRGVETLRAEIIRSLGKNPLVVAGGTPTFPIHAKRKGVELSPGTFIFWDKGYQSTLHEQPFEFAALVATRVISVPDEYTLCLDLGHKAIASENSLPNRVHILNASGFEPVGHSEEHLVLRSATKHAYKTGELFYGVPYHICPTVALYEEAAICRDNRVGESWPIVARKRKISI
jgi:D-serine deaminase-like pyridoxal phosphate-dependent protein